MTSLLFTPIKIGTMDVKNRVVMAPLETNFATPDGEVNERVLAFYEERAKGGAGLLISEGTYVDTPGKARLNQFAVYDDKFVPGLRRLAEKAHNHGAKIVLQLAHAGRQTRRAFSGSQPVAPSPLPCKCAICNEVPRALTVDEIKQTVEAFGEAARRAKEAKFDGAEIHGAHGYLIYSFVSPRLNKRIDEYGGNADRRMKFALDIVAKTREKVGLDFPLLYRLSAIEFAEGGLTIGDTRLLAKRLEEAGINALDVSGGIYETGGITPYMNTPPGHLTRYAKKIREVVKIPIITVGGINDPSLAEETLRNGSADLIAAGRPFFSDPYWPLKASEKRNDEITKCLRCNVCLNRLFFQRDVVCTVNPALGMEREYQIKPSPKPKVVLIVGGGVAGMEAARVASLRGHKVILCEKDEKLGGQAILAAKAKHKQDFIAVTECLESQVKKLKVELLLRCKVDLNVIKKINPEVVILATGVLPIVPIISGADTERTTTTFDVLSGKKSVGKRVLIVGGGLIGAETAIYLAEKGKNVTISTRRSSRNEIAQDAISDAQNCILDEISKRNLNVVTSVKLKEIKDGKAIFEKLAPTTSTKLGTEETIGDFDNIIFAYGSIPERSLYNPVKNAGYIIYAIGDCETPRTALEAIHEGYQVALQI